ncbi:hypothetical protein [Xanthobacter sp. KR7-65]|uniref:hypothetical protein n=1 Tax=Xanthobacter sp. KR7-65 TaxID=3156612 RepID=UPI0032B35441
MGRSRLFRILSWGLLGLLLAPPLIILPLLTGRALAQDAGVGPAVLVSGLANELVGLFVVATILESALATLFNWRLYREFFNGKAVKTIIMVAFGYAIVTLFNYDVVYRIIASAGGEGSQGPLSRFLSAMVLAGGSAAVYQLFKALGLRPPVEPSEARPQPPQDKAWVSVRIIRKAAVGDVSIHVDTVADPAEELRAKPAIVGVIGAGSAIGTRLKALFFADVTRFPTYGGHAVEAGEQVYRIVALGHRRSDNAGDPPVPFSREIYAGRFARRAIVDFVQSI